MLTSSIGGYNRRIFFTVMLSVVMLNAKVLSVVILYANVVNINVIMLNVVAPFTLLRTLAT
jgi:hypothetical protein